MLVASGLRGNDNKAIVALSIGVALLMAACFVLMISPEQAELRGFWQRLADYAMFVFIVILRIHVPALKTK